MVVVCGHRDSRAFCNLCGVMFVVVSLMSDGVTDRRETG